MGVGFAGFLGCCGPGFGGLRISWFWWVLCGFWVGVFGCLLVWGVWFWLLWFMFADTCMVCFSRVGLG